jgi:hypothetical protein
MLNAACFKLIFIAVDDGFWSSERALAVIVLAGFLVSR